MGFRGNALPQNSIAPSLPDGTSAAPDAAAMREAIAPALPAGRGYGPLP